MPLLVMSPNIQDGAESLSRKRSHEEYLDDSTTKSSIRLAQDVENVPVIPSEGHTPPSLPSISADSPPSGSPESLLTDVGTSTPARPSPSPNPTPSKSTAVNTQLVISIDSAMPSSLSASPSAQGATGTPPPAKRKRLTPAEKEEKAKADAARKEEKAKADAARKEEKEKAEAAKKLERAAAEAEKKARAEEREREREKKRKQKEEEDRRRAEEKDKKRKEKEDEERKVQEAKEKKERSQLRLNSFFKTGAPSTPKKASPFAEAAAAAATAPPASAGSSPVKVSPKKVAIESSVPEYERIFKPFFIKENVIMATALYGLDDEAKAAKSRTLDDYVSGKRGSFTPAKLDASTVVDYFQLPCRIPHRGRTRPSVKKIMTMMTESGDAQDAQAKLAMDLLKTVPMKFLGFREDVRPAYYGTATNLPTDAPLSKLARKPLAKTVVPLNYDYDSEAEWVDDGDGEDVDDLDDDEEELDEDEEMDDFLDDSEEAAPLRAAFSTGLEPESTGICWEGQAQPVSGLDLDAFRMEFILDHDEAIDPFSTKYWEPAPVAEPTPAPTSTSSKTTTKDTSSSNHAMAPPPAPADAFAALGTTSASTTNSKPDPKKACVAPELVDDFKKSIMQYAKLSKIGVVEILSAEFPKCTKNQIKNSLEALAERTGTGQQKTWKLK